MHTQKSMLNIMNIHDRKAGILLHPSSLPSIYGIGEFGSHAYQFIDFLYKSGQKLWQILPLGPTGYGDSPYATLSSYAGNELLISLELLEKDGYIHIDPTDIPIHDAHTIDFMHIRPWKIKQLQKAALAFYTLKNNPSYAEFTTFCEQEAYWLDDYALFIVIKNHHDPLAEADEIPSTWNTYWDSTLALRHKKTLQQWTQKHEQDIIVIKILQYFFFTQWMALKQYAHDHNIHIIGDIPIFVAEDSADVWTHRELFDLDAHGRPIHVAGVPPDYFSKTGQRWGNPLYNWKRMQADNFSWWKSRIAHSLRLYDIIRIDHFRGFEAFWQIPAKETTAILGKWITAPGTEFFIELHKHFGDNLPIIAEDLGVITDEVRTLKESNHLPGMKILQFAFENDTKNYNAANDFLPHQYTPSSIVYTGTHDNETTTGWLQTWLNAENQYTLQFFHEYSGLKTTITSKNIYRMLWQMIRMAYASVSMWCIIPLQDIFAIDNSGRMNTPSQLGNNWHWRYHEKDIKKKKYCTQLQKLCILYHR